MLDHLDVNTIIFKDCRMMGGEPINPSSCKPRGSPARGNAAESIDDKEELTVLVTGFGVRQFLAEID